VIKVTTLAASGPGSLQAALDVAGPRIIVFAVSGVIEGDVTVTHGDVTIAGQTAPGAGITLNGRLIGEYDSSVGNIVIRHLRVRPIYDGGPGEQFDALQFSLNSLLMLDHMSVSWGVDETMDLYEANDVTVQYSTVEEAATMGHPEGEHNYGLIQGPDGYGISVHHNLFIDNKNRNPAIANGPAEVLNNVVYNVRHGFIHHNPASGQFNIVGNVYIQGPNDDLIPFYFDDENDFSAPDLSYYLADNYIDDPGDFVGVVDNPWLNEHPTFQDMLAPEALRATQPHTFGGEHVPVTTQSSTEARMLVLEKAGAFPRDAVTKRVIEELENGSGDWGSHPPNDLLEGLTPGTYPTDADDDGMADDWETDHSLDPANGDDHSTVMPSGYTAIEEYINELAEGSAGPGPEPTGSGGAGGAGSGPSGSGGASSSQAAGVGGASNGNGADGSDDGASGCACRAPARAPSSAAGLFALLAATVLWLRRKRA
jgi:hypothetical protein